MVGQCSAILFICFLVWGEKKNPRQGARGGGNCYLWYILNGLFLSRCSYWTYICASSAVNASICIDYIRCSFCNSLYRATIHASTTADAIFTNLISHNNPPMINNSFDFFISIVSWYNGFDKVNFL